ncbi:MAG: hypothetical protein ABIQ84_03155 [Usitatibacter sp.]
MKKTLTAAEAKELLEREFARLKPAGCSSCKVPIPFWGPAVVTGTGYWYLRVLPDCPDHCGRVISTIWADITTEYQIERSAAESGMARYEGALGRTAR